MSKNSIELINNYVSPEVVSESMTMGELSQVEFDAAVQGVCISRAQFVVDSALAELHSRLPSLHEKRESAVRRLARVDNEIDVVRDELAKARGVDLAEGTDISLWADQNNALHLLKIFEANTKNQFLELLRNEPPFSVWLTPNDEVEHLSHVNDKTYPMYLRKLIQVLPHAPQSIGRAAGYLRVLGPKKAPELANFANFIRDRSEESDTSSISYGRVDVENPQGFFAAAFKISDFGLQSAKSILGGAYAQREELEQSQTN